MAEEKAGMIVEADGLQYLYAGMEEPALNGITMTVPEGSFIAVIGPNGSGKSTFAKLLNVLIAPTGGRVTVCGMDTRDEARIMEIRQRVGMVFQNPDNQIVATVVEEDVAFGPENLGVPSAEIRERVARALADVGMQDFALKAPHMLSGGQKQRVAIAGALAMRPRLLVLDESTAMLDPEGRREVMRTVRMLRETIGMTVIWITHHMEEAAEADEIVVVREGRVELTGTPREVFALAERLDELGLEAPPAAALANALRACGMPIASALTVDELADELTRLLGGG